MILNTLLLENFKSHKNTKIEFGPVTSFVGRNSKGKTSGSFLPLSIILRNQNFPAKYITKGEKESVLILETPKHIITRRRNSSKQSLTIKTGNKVTPYSGKKGLNDIISNTLGLRDVILDDVTGLENINFIRPRAGWFLMEKSPDVLRRRLVGILGLYPTESAKNELEKENKILIKSLNEKKNTLESLQAQLNKEEQRLNLVLNQERLTNIFDISNQLNSIKDLPTLELPQINFDLLEYFTHTEIVVPEINFPDAQLELILKYISLEDISTESLEAELAELSSQLEKYEYCETCGQPILPT